MSLGMILAMQTKLSSQERDMKMNNIREESAHDMHSDCDCVPLNEEISELIESDEPWKLEGSACGPIREGDEVENAIQNWITVLKQADYIDEDAERAVFDALAQLVENNVIPDSPEYDSPVFLKEEWVSRFNNQMKPKLISMGLEV